MNALEVVDPVEPPVDDPRPAPACAPQARRLHFDERRPWPLGLPAASEVLEAIGAAAEVDEALQAAHLHVLALLPEHLYDAARTSLAGAVDPVALATASAWRTLVAVERGNAALGVDQPALRALIDEAVDAREKLLAAGYFALDGGESAEELMAALGDAIEQLTGQAHFKPRPKTVLSGTGTRLLSLGGGEADPEAVRGRPLRWAFAATMILTALFHLTQFVTSEEQPPWVVVGDVDRGHAFLAPSGPNADEAALQALIVQLASQGVKATRSGSGEWVLQRSTQAAP